MQKDLDKDSVTGNIEALSSNGDGIMKIKGLVFFVPFTAPHDQISCKIVNVKKNYGHAKLTTLLKKSEERVNPTCPFFKVCGGCQLQHLKYAAQIKNKQQWIKDALIRIGKYENVNVNEVIPSEKIYGYRQHISLSIINENGKCDVGYIGFDGYSLIKVTECPIFILNNLSFGFISPDIQSDCLVNDGSFYPKEITPAILKEKSPSVARQAFEDQRNKPETNLFNHLRAMVSELEMKEEKAKVTVLKQESENYILHFHFKTLPSNAKPLTLELLNHEEIKGVILSSKKGVLKFGISETTYSLDNLKLKFASDMFMQNNREQSTNIYHHIVRIAKEASPTAILDLYCGIGISSLLLAKEGFQVTGIECNSQSIKMAKKNAENNGLLSKTKFIQAAVENVLDNIEIPEFVIINPPREGLDKQVILALRKRHPEKIVYISCMPSTLARDLQLFGNENYTIEECQPYDMFPQTIHVETVIVLKKKA